MMTLEAKAEPAGDTERGGDGGGKVKPEATMAAKAAEVTAEAKVTDNGIDDSGDSGGGGGVGDGDGSGVDGVGGNGVGGGYGRGGGRRR